jgi:hypothetical protein
MVSHHHRMASSILVSSTETLTSGGKFALRRSWRSSYPLCRAILLRPDSKLTTAIDNPNQWGVEPTTTGALCMNVSV